MVRVWLWRGIAWSGKQSQTLLIDVYRGPEISQTVTYVQVITVVLSTRYGDSEMMVW